MEVILEIIYH